MTQRHVVIAVPAYTGTIHLGTMRSIIADMLGFADRGDKVSLLDDCGNAMIADCRNKIVADFLASDATDLIFVDADVAWAKGTLLQLVDYPVDCVAAIYPQRKDPINFCVRYLDDPDKKGIYANEETGLIEVDGVPFGCVKLSRSMCEQMVKHYADTEYFCQGTLTDKAWDLFGSYWMEKLKFGEDYSFCRRWRDMGGKIWIAPEMNMGHIGNKTFIGCLGEYLRNRPPEEESK